MSIYLSGVESVGLGCRVARGKVETPDDVTDAEIWAQDHKAVLTVLRCPVTAVDAAQRMESNGFLLADTLVYFAIDTRKVAPNLLEEVVPVREYGPRDKGEVLEVTRASFTDFTGHYHRDPWITKEQATNAYVSWAKRSCEGDAGADAILVVEMDERVVGYVTLQITEPFTGEVVLGGVHPEYQGRGIYRTLIEHGIRWFIQHEVPVIQISTPIDNLAVQKVWCRLGLEPTKAYYTFHFWSDYE